MLLKYLHPGKPYSVFWRMMEPNGKLDQKGENLYAGS